MEVSGGECRARRRGKFSRVEGLQTVFEGVGALAGKRGGYGGGRPGRRRRIWSSFSLCCAMGVGIDTDDDVFFFGLCLAQATYATSQRS